MQQTVVTLVQNAHATMFGKQPYRPYTAKCIVNEQQTLFRVLSPCDSAKLLLLTKFNIGVRGTINRTLVYRYGNPPRTQPCLQRHKKQIAITTSASAVHNRYRVYRPIVFMYVVTPTTCIRGPSSQSAYSSFSQARELINCMRRVSRCVRTNWHNSEAALRQVRNKGNIPEGGSSNFA